MHNILFYSDSLSNYEYSKIHPFKPERAKLMMELLNRYSLINEGNQKILEPEPIDEELLYLFHEKRYIDALKRCDRDDYGPEMLIYGLGTSDCPVAKGMYNFALTAAGGTHKGAMMILNGEAGIVFNPIGGFHHAGPGNAEGFCYINDIAVAISDCVRKGYRVACIDIDVHHGNGVQNAFYDTSDVLTISLHESGQTLYPWAGFENEIGEGKGRGYNINIPLIKETDDEVFLYAFESIVPPIVSKFKPDIIFAELGGDTHMEDPLANLDLTSNGYRKVVAGIKDLSDRILATGGGGYKVNKTAALWALAWAVLCGIEPNDMFAGSVGGMMYGPEMNSGSLNDKPFVHGGYTKEKCLEHARGVVEYIQKNVFPIHRI